MSAQCLMLNSNIQHSLPFSLPAKFLRFPPSLPPSLTGGLMVQQGAAKEMTSIQTSHSCLPAVAAVAGCCNSKTNNGQVWLMAGVRPQQPWCMVGSVLFRTRRPPEAAQLLGQGSGTGLGHLAMVHSNWSQPSTVTAPACKTQSRTR